jgi:hypothetical protein
MTDAREHPDDKSHPSIAYDKYFIDDGRIEDLEPLPVIAEELGVTEKSLYGWYSRREANGFPEPWIALGKHILFDKYQVFAWHRLWTKVSRGQMGNPQHREARDG